MVAVHLHLVKETVAILSYGQRGECTLAYKDYTQTTITSHAVTKSYNYEYL